jgi:uncharacterized membrane protein YdjX (TVP38/TMEM64 family)
MTSAAVLAFLLSRYLFRTPLQDYLSKRFPLFPLYDRALALEGAKFVFLMQFSLIPYSLLCFLFGCLTHVPLISFTVGVLGMGLPNLFWAYCGSLLKNIKQIATREQEGGMQMIFMGIGMGVAFAGMYRLQRAARIRIQEKIEIVEGIYNEGTSFLNSDETVRGRVGS